MGFFRRMTSQRVTAATEAEDLTFECMSANGTIYLVGYNNVLLVDLEYKVNDGEYEPYEYTDVELTQGDKVSFRGVNTIDCFSTGQSDYIQFEMEGQWNASGDVTSLIGRSDTIGDWCFYQLFKNCKGLLTAPQLPSTTLGEGCYCKMFYGCESLMAAPQLPAMHLSGHC